MRAFKKLPCLVICLLLFGLMPESNQALAGPVEEITVKEYEALLANRQGKPLVLVYWASWCGPCRLYQKKLEALREAYPESELNIIGISLDSDPARLSRYVENNELPYRTYQMSSELRGVLGPLSVPTTMLYDVEGSKAREVVGNTGERRLKHYVSKLIPQE